jgi:hypothetical protein
VSEKYAFIDAEKARYPIAKMCVWLEVSTSGYYEWRNRPPSAAVERRKRLATLIQAIFDESDGTYGYRRVHAALARQKVVASNWSVTPCVSCASWRASLVRGGRRPPKPVKVAPRLLT